MATAAEEASEQVEDQQSVLRAHLSQVDARLEALEGQNRDLQRRVAEEGDRLAKLVADRFEQVASLMRQQQQVSPDKESSSSSSPSLLLELAPKLTQLQSNLDVLLTGESEANAVIDKLVPAVSALREELSALSERQGRDLREIAGKVGDCRDCVDATKSYVKENLDVTEDVLDKMKRGHFQRCVNNICIVGIVF